MLTLRQRIFSGIGLILGLIISFLLFYTFVFDKTDTTVVDENGVVVENGVIADDGNGGINSEQGDSQVVVEPDMIIPNIEPNELHAKQAAILFVERFSSYSNQNYNTHIDNVVSLVTDNMAEWVKTQGLKLSNEYEGVTTNVIVSTVDSINDSTAVVLVEAQQVLETATTQEVVQKTGRVNLVKVGNDWKVSGFYWD